MAEDLQGRRQYRISLRDIGSERWSPETLENTSGNMVWANDNQTLFYVRNHPQTLLPYQVYRHQYGTPTAEDKLVYQENDPAFYLSLGRSSSRDYLILTISGNTTSEVRLIDANQPQRERSCSPPGRTAASITSITTAVSSTCVPTIRIRTLACTARRRRANPGRR